MVAPRGYVSGGALGPRAWAVSAPSRVLGVKPRPACKGTITSRRAAKAGLRLVPVGDGDVHCHRALCVTWVESLYHWGQPVAGRTS